MIRKITASSAETQSNIITISCNIYFRALFERNSSQNNGGFREHIKINHYMWNYLFFIAYLRWKDETEYSGKKKKKFQKCISLS